MVVQVSWDLSGKELENPDAVARMASWNVCNRDEAKFALGYPDLCWFDADIGLEGATGSVTTPVPLELPPGLWYVRIRGDLLGAVSGAVRAFDSGQVLPFLSVTPNWDMCMVRCRRRGGVGCGIDGAA